MPVDPLAQFRGLRGFIQTVRHLTRCLHLPITYALYRRADGLLYLRDPIRIRKDDHRSQAILQNEHNSQYGEAFFPCFSRRQHRFNMLLATLMKALLQLRLKLIGDRDHRVWVWAHYEFEDSGGINPCVKVRMASRKAQGFDEVLRIFPPCKLDEILNYDNGPPRMMKLNQLPDEVWGNPLPAEFFE